MKSIVRSLLMLLGRLLSRLIYKIEVTGWENLPPKDIGSLLVISNHFSWFEPFILGIYLRDYNIRFYAAAEVKAKPFMRPVIFAYDPILVRRGQVDRNALREAIDTLENGQSVAIFPEGGIDPNLRDRVNRGEPIHAVRGHVVRESGQLIDARPGAAYLAVRTGAPIMPVAFLGTEHTLTNLRRLRRTPVSMIIGPIFGPVSLNGTPRGTERRQQLDAHLEKMMFNLAALVPPANRGPYK